MNRVKRFFAIVVLIIGCLALTACGREDSESESEQTETVYGKIVKIKDGKVTLALGNKITGNKTMTGIVTDSMIKTLADKDESEVSISDLKVGTVVKVEYKINGTGIRTLTICNS